MASRASNDAPTDPHATLSGTRDSEHKTDPHAPAQSLEHIAAHDVKTEPGGLVALRDPIEDDPRYLAVIASVDVEVQALVTAEKKAHPEVKVGWAHSEWAHKKRLLKERHGLDWKTPLEMNPAGNP
ncbi:MAG: hypothetical protein K1X64_07065 [Myxococcaceae bacterium]|nr:hypothetical protein [Myxococcaceae bacterium]